MIFGVLNPEKIWHQQLVHLPTSPVYCSHFTLGNPKVSFQQYYSFILPISYVISKKTNCYFITHYTWKMPSHYLVKIAQILHLFHLFTCIEYQFAIRMCCGTAASCCNMAAFQQSIWWMIQLISDKKDWKHVSVQKVVTLNIVVMLLAWHSICHTSHPVLFRATNANPQPAHFRSTNVWRNAHTFSQKNSW